MKIYGLTSSERATKGQGGNTFVETVYTVEHANKEREVISKTRIDREDGAFIVRHIPVKGNSIVYRIPIRTK